MIRYRNGSYEVIVHIGPNPATGRERRVSRSVRMPERRRVPAEVRDLEARLRLEVTQGHHGNPHVMVGELLDRWITHARADLSPTTRHGYEKSIRLYLKPALGKVKLAKLTTAQLDRLYRTLLASGGEDGRPLSPATVRQAHAVMRRALVAAERWGWVARNVAALAEPPSVQRAPTDAPALAQIATLHAAADPDLGLLILLAIGTGMRRGELCGLSWADVDLPGGSVLVRYSAVEIGHQVTVKTPKSGRARRVPIGPHLVAALKARHTEQAETALAFGAKLELSAYVLSQAPDGSVPLHPNLASDRFRRLTRSHGMKIRLHDLRHAFATHALGQGASIPDVAAVLGHAQSSTTLNTYSHALPAGQRAIADLLDVALQGPP